MTCLINESLSILCPINRTEKIATVKLVAFLFSLSVDLQCTKKVQKLTKSAIISSVSLVHMLHPVSLFHLGFNCLNVGHTLVLFEKKRIVIQEKTNVVWFILTIMVTLASYTEKSKGSPFFPKVVWLQTIGHWYEHFIIVQIVYSLFINLQPFSYFLRCRVDIHTLGADKQNIKYPRKLEIFSSCLSRKEYNACILFFCYVAHFIHQASRS